VIPTNAWIAGKVMERLTVSKQEMPSFDMEICSLKKIKEIDSKKDIRLKFETQSQL
jgi:hypothetical protein